MVNEVLVLHLKGIYYDQIEKLEKTCEYRALKPYWTKRLRNKTIIHFFKGYPKRGTFPLVRWIDNIIHNEETKQIEIYLKTPEEEKFDMFYADADLGDDGDEDEEDNDEYYEEELEEEEEDSGFLGSMLEAQLIRDGSVICEACGKPIRSVLDTENPNTCPALVHQQFKMLFDTRIKIGLHDLKTRGYD